MERAKTIDEIYAEVRDHDLVVTNDAALATALNARIDRPVIGSFAVTPMQLASDLATDILGQPTWSDLRVISAICDETGYDFRFVHGEIENIREIRRHTAEVRKHLTTKASRRVYDSYEPLPTLDRAMGAFVPEDCELYRNAKVAVIEPFLFDDLDKHFVPLDCDIVEILVHGEDYGIDTLHEIGNDRQVAENAVALIDPSRASDYAIVVNVGSPITDAVRSALYRRNLPFVNSLTVRDLAQVRDYIQFLRLSLSYETLRVRNVRELFSNYNGFFKPGREGFLLSRQTSDDMRDRALELRDMMASIRSMTFGEVRDRLCDQRARIQVGIVLEDLGLTHEPVTSSRVSDLVYAVENVADLHHNEEIPENEKVGVLITDCRRSLYIDRPVVMLLGMGQDWDQSVNGKRYIDREDEADRDVLRKKVLLQQGARRLYCINTSKRGERARPMSVLESIMGRSLKDFGPVARETVTGRWYEPEEAVMPVSGETSIDPGETGSSYFSKSSFNAYYSCPRSFMYSKLLESEAEKPTEFGSLIHEFAELYICYRDRVRADGIDRYVGMVSDRYSGLSSPLLEGMDSERIRRAMCNVMAFIDLLDIRDPPLDTVNGTKDHPNRFMVAEGLEMTSSVCELPTGSRSDPVFGKYDLLWDGAIHDYKTGKMASSKEIAKAMTVDSGARYPEFQPLLYLMTAKPRHVDRFELFYAMGRDVESLEPGFDIRGNIRHVRIHHGDIRGCMRESRRLRSQLAGSINAKFRERSDLFLDTLLDTAVGEVSDWDSDHAVLTALLEVMGMNDNKTNRGTVAASVRRVTGCVQGGMLVTDTAVEVPEPVLDAFSAFVRAMHDRMMLQSGTDLPAEPRGNCRDCRYFQACTREVVKVEGGSDDAE
ncbi:MAG: PD-(D/E)XK nuclease family protein [Candidatus Methanomethylophilaceae archaeon]|nr:PD-(D/E)XK nuclease family protein [Candidatus Methanomethylophilaceae archaeon]